MLTRLPSALLALHVTVAVAAPRSLQIDGVAGYLSEWELSGAVPEAAPAGQDLAGRDLAGRDLAGREPAGREFAGQVTWRHVGVCSPNGPVEKVGNLRLRLSAGATRVDATLTFEGRPCTYTAAGGRRASGFMDCPDAKGVPLSITIR
ncbi:MAG: hypothetical protein IT537_09740 [Hyphomicrobiales bacterium]|nr:hypothetical protein [Hyphomicrobiales bacterium]